MGDRMDVREGFGEYMENFYNEIMCKMCEFRKNVLLAILDTCKDVVSKGEVAKLISKKTSRPKSNIESQLDDQKSRPADLLCKYHIILTLPKPMEAEKRKPDEFFVLTDVGKWIKDECDRYGDWIHLKPPKDDSLLKKIALIGEKMEKYNCREMLLYLTLSKHTNVEDPKINVRIETPKDKDWKRPGCKIYGRIEEAGLVIHDEEELERDLRKLVTYWIREILLSYSKYDKNDIERIIKELKFNFKSEENVIEFEAEVEPYGIIK